MKATQASQASGLFKRRSPGEAVDGAPEEENPHEPASHVEIPLSAYADTWKQKPKAPVTIGLRLLAERDYESGSKRALEEAWKAVPHGPEDRWHEAYINSLMRWVVARGTCERHDVTTPAWSAFDEYVGAAFTPDGLKLLYQAVEDHKITQSCLAQEITRDEFAVLARVAASPLAVDRLLERLTPREKRRLHYCLNEMRRLTADVLSPEALGEERYPVIDDDPDLAGTPPLPH